MLLRDWLSGWRCPRLSQTRTSRSLAQIRRKGLKASFAGGEPEVLEIRTLPSAAYTFTQAAWDSSNPMYNRDLGTGARPTLVDIDHDGDLDNLSGNEFGNFYYYQNTGTSSTPAFLPQSQVTTGSFGNPMRSADVGDGSVLAWGDLDGDMDLDLMVGNQQGLFLYYKNLGTITSPNLTSQSGSNNPLNGVDVGVNAAPVFADLDNDGDLDMIAGDFQLTGGNLGELRFFLNTGTSTSPVFVEQTGASSPVNGVTFDAYSVPKPTLIDLDKDGDFDMVVGLSDASLAYFENTGTKFSPVFTQRTGSDNPWNGVTPVANPAFPPSNAAPFFGDLDGDGDPDLLVGLGNGMCAYFVATAVPTGADLELTQSVEAISPNVGTTVTFTVTITNQGTQDATGITIANPIPTGLTGVTFTPSAGSYSAGVWTIASLTSSSSATLTIEGTIVAAGSDISNSAEVTASDQNDPDSTANNHEPSEDDQTTSSFHVNANPTLTVSGSATLDTISVNVPNNLNHGTLISDLIARLGPSGGITDPDSGALQGIALNGTSGNSTGTWEFSINDGANWASVGTVNNDGARLLAANSTTRLRYVPNNGFKGVAKFSFVAWDQSVGTNGGLGITKFRTGSSPFSLDYDLASITVTNVAPVLDPDGSPSLAPISVNIPNMNNHGTLISDLIASMSPSGGITDTDDGAVQGIAINGLANANGAWEYTINDGTNWASIGTTGNSNARLLAANPNTRIRFVPNPGFKGSATFAFVAWDQTTGANGGTANVGTRGGMTPFSSVYEYGSISVTNAAPVLTPSGSSHLDPILNTISNNSNTGILITDLISRMGPGGSITDSDPGALQGIAIVGLLGEGTGTWQYSTNDGTTWSAVAATGTTNARLVAADPNTRVRYVPNSGFIGQVKFAFVAWDQTTGVNGSLINAGNRGGTTAFSTLWDYATLSVNGEIFAS